MVMTLTGTCQCEPDGRASVYQVGRMVCMACGKQIVKDSPRNAKMPDDIQREVRRLRRIVNESLDRIDELTNRHAG